MSILLSFLGIFILIFGFLCICIEVFKFFFFRGGTSFKDEQYNGIEEKEFDEEKIGGQVVKDNVGSNQEIV